MRNSILILFLCISIGFSQIIIQDNFKPTLDKNAHLTTSFGLYYTFRYFKYNETNSFINSTVVGILYEVSQLIYDPFESQNEFSGISLHDIAYNVMGITVAYTLDKTIQKLKKKYLKPK